MMICRRLRAGEGRQEDKPHWALYVHGTWGFRLLSKSTMESLKKFKHVTIFKFNKEVLY